MEKINMIDLQKRKLKSCYIVVYVVTKEIKIRTDTCIANKKLYILFDIDSMGSKFSLTSSSILDF